MPASDFTRPSVPPEHRDDDPDPSFWGPEDRVARRRRPRRAAPGGPNGLLGTRGERRVVVAVAAVLAVAAALVSYRASTPVSTPAPVSASPTPTAAAPTRGPGGKVVVHVAGAVSRPGVVELPAADRVIDALDAAGGALADADLDRVNLAARLHDAEQILVPTTAPPPTSAPPPTTTTSTTAPPPTTATTG